MKAVTFETLLTPPHDNDAEQAVIGGLILDNAAIARIGTLEGRDFYREDHRVIFRAIRDLAASDIPRDVLTLSDHLRNAGRLDDIGGLAYLATMAKLTPSAANIAAYANIVREKSLQRQLLEAAQQLQVDAVTSPPEQSIDSGIATLLDLSLQQQQGKQRWHGAKDGIKAALRQIEVQSKKPVGEVIGLPSGITDIDAMLSGLEKAKQYLIAGRPGMGKSTFAINVAVKNALAGKSVAIFSLEMPKASLWNKMLASVGRVDFDRIKNAQQLTEDDWPKLATAVKALSDTSIHIDDTPGVSPAYIRAALNQLVAETGRPVDLVIIDYIQLMTASAGNDTSTENALLTAISRELMSIKKAFDCPVLVLSQLNRGVEQRPNKRPMLSDLRGSGSLEQDADGVLMLYRDEYYNDESPDRGIAEVSVVKNREGKMGTVKTVFLGKYQRFENCDYRCHQHYQGGVA